MKNLLRKLLVGDQIITEYSTLPVPDTIKEKFLLIAGNTALDVTDKQCVLCLEPVVLAFWLEEKKEISSIQSHTQVQLIGGYRDEYSDSEFKNNKAVSINLESYGKIEETDGTLFLFKISETVLSHIPAFKTSILFNRYYKKPGLSFEKYKALIAAYSYPRKVRLVSFRDNEHFNIFPMDLVGKLGTGRRMVFGLRHTNITLSKIIAAGKLVISEISHQHKDTIYQLGKHHSQHPPSPESLPFKTFPSKNFQFHVSDWVDRYYEVKINQTKNLGSHMLMWGEIIDETVLKGPSPALYHIHFLQHLYQVKHNYAYPLV